MTVEFDVIQLVVGGFGFELVLLVKVSPRGQVRMPEQGIVVEIDLGVQGEDLTFTGCHQGIDLGQGTVHFHVHFVEPQDETKRLTHQGALQSQPESKPPRLKGLQPHPRVHLFPEDLFRSPGGHLLDFHPTFWTGHDHQLALGPVQGDAQIEFPVDITGLLHQDLLHLLAIGTGLVRDQVHADDLGGHVPGLLRIECHLDAPPLAAAPGVYLGLDHHPTSQIRSDVAGFLWRASHLSPGHGYLVLAEQFFGLILVYFHARRAFLNRYRNVKEYAMLGLQARCSSTPNPGRDCLLPNIH